MDLDSVRREGRYNGFVWFQDSQGTIEDTATKEARIIMEHRYRTKKAHSSPHPIQTSSPNQGVGIIASKS